MASSSTSCSHFSAHFVEPGLGKLEKLPPEDSTVYMAEPNAGATTGNPITTNNKVLFGVTRKQMANNGGTVTAYHHGNGHSNWNSGIAEHHGNGQTATGGNGETVIGGHHDNGQLVADESSSSSSSSSEGSGSEQESSSAAEEEAELSDETELKRAGVELDLDTLGSPGGSGGVAPLQLLSEFVSCCVRDEYRAALILCKKVLEFEPNNATAQEFFPMLQERLKLDEELSTESSSDETSDAESTSSDSSHDGQPANTCRQTMSHSHDQCCT